MNKIYNHRVIMISDMHYTTQETSAELKLHYPEAKASVAAGDTLGHSQQGKINCILDDINAFTANQTIDGIIVLGDLSIDDYSYRNLPENYCEKFKKDCMSHISYPTYVIPGNHDSYPDDMWKEVFGYNRQYSFKLKDTAFIMLDTFNDCPSQNASGSAYTGIDIEFLKKELEKYPTEQIFLCSHYFMVSQFPDELIELLNSNNRIVCLFDGHTHKSRVFTELEKIKQPKINIGGYGYHGEKREDGKWYFDRYDDDWAWGYEVLEWNDTEAHVYHVKPARRYEGFNGVFEHPYTIENELTIYF